MSAGGAVGVLLAMLATIGFLDGLAVLWVHGEERARERFELERRRVE